MAPGMRHASWSRGFAAFACDIVEAMREGSTVEGAATFKDGYRVQLVLDAARASNKSGRWTSGARRQEQSAGRSRNGSAFVIYFSFGKF